MKSAILASLGEIESDHGVRILYAVESGSRAWGFASQDSDYDVRFLYVHPRDRYLSIREIRDVIELPVSGALDINGWDLRKALALFRKSNPPLLEWLDSPIVYIDRGGLAEKMRGLLAGTFSPQRCMHHYLHMAEGNFREYLKGDVVRLKKYLYVLRPVLACMWIEKHEVMPPTGFEKGLEDALLPEDVRLAVDRLLESKMAGAEMDDVPRVQVLNDFLEEKLAHFSGLAGKVPSPVADDDALDRLFREVLES